MQNYKEYSSDQLNLQKEIQKFVDEKDYLSATLLAYSSIEYMLQQLILMRSIQINPETYNKISRIKLSQAGLILYYAKIIDQESLNIMDSLYEKRNSYAHDFIKKHLSKKKEDFGLIIKLYAQVFDLYLKELQSKKPEK